MDIILASQSPRRRELLELCKVDFTCKPAELDESVITYTILNRYAGKSCYEISDRLTKELALKKAESVFEKGKGQMVIGSDTVVSTEDRILGKPSDKYDAYNMLKSLCGKTHRVYTGVCVMTDEREITFSTFTEVRFRDYDAYTEQIIRDYIETGSPMDKAGAYGIQDMGALLVEEIKGDYYTVMGLPISKLYSIIRKDI